ncbi:Ger(x)C family spore germination protein [Terribacillus sp. AE2B 122]|jgi:spore germination protein KC|uniref:Ger(x)C family spore germination protein n=1 Tax=Terribacillus sp. AE2B 122 TaxID=1331902 RepID=UPI001440CE00|nr:Ger(x)C family spore germination protein [Terribacillus sp. AE2B 122]VVM34131.1 Spore germination protein GerKC [Terribacillus sp. AE2B 122]
MRQFILILSLLQLAMILSGCYDRKELEEQAYVITIAVDKTDRDNIFRFTFEIANPEVGSSATTPSTNEPAQEIISVLGTDFLSATSTANSSIAKEITLEQVRVVIVSEKLARSKEFIHLMQSAPSTVDLKLNAQLVISKEKAEEFVRHNSPNLESRPHKYFQYMLDRARETGVIPDAPLVRFFQITEGDADLFVAPYASTVKKPKDSYGDEDSYKAGEIDFHGGNVTQFMGSAVFKEGQMIDSLTGEETRYIHMMDPTFPQQVILSTFVDPLEPEYNIAARVQLDKVKVKIDYKKNQTSTIDVYITTHLNIFAIPSTEDYMKSQKKRKILYDSIQKEILKNGEKLVKKTQEEYKAEPFYWSLHIRKKFLSIKDYEQADWSNKIYPNAHVRLHVKVASLEFGKTLRQSDIGRVRD